MRSKAGGDRLSFIDFQLPTLVDDPPEGDAWIHEIKYDGYRTQLVIQGGEARAFTRRGFDWSAKYLPIVEAARGLPAKAAIIDGEAVVMNEAGLSDFSKLRSAIRWQAGRIIFVAFDLMHLDGKDLRQLPTIAQGGAGASSRRHLRQRHPV
jgi:bifunctional non-homologous end joining protein LigD